MPKVLTINLRKKYAGLYDWHQELLKQDNEYQAWLGARDAERTVADLDRMAAANESEVRHVA